MSTADRQMPAFVPHALLADVGAAGVIQGFVSDVQAAVSVEKEREYGGGEERHDCEGRD